MKRQRSTRTGISKLLFAGSIIVGLLAVAFLINNVLLFKNTVAQYVAQGYNAAEVTQGLMASQLIPGIFEPVAIYGGMALLLFGAASINQKVATALALLSQSAGAEVTEPEAVSCADELSEFVLEEDSDEAPGQTSVEAEQAAAPERL